MVRDAEAAGAGDYIGDGRAGEGNMRDGRAGPRRTMGGAEPWIPLLFLLAMQLDGRRRRRRVASLAGCRFGRRPRPYGRPNSAARATPSRAMFNCPAGRRPNFPLFPRFVPAAPSIALSCPVKQISSVSSDDL